ncbi:hypothetical protein [Mycoplasma sp. Z473B]|uniref:hypothetical protein n=1 Tax=Mycoplasma sp. Z473B TaxID=3401667 RepID=UPI003AADA3D4
METSPIYVSAKDKSSANSNLINVNGRYYIKGYENIRDASYPANVNGTCGYTAATILLYWWHKKLGDIIPDKFISPDGGLLKYGYTLQDELLSIGRDLGYDNSSWGKPMRNILVEYFKRNVPNHGATSWYYLLRTYLWGEIDRGRPAIAFGSFYGNPPSVYADTTNHDYGGKVFHGVVVYGYSNSNYICHYGWEGFEEVYLHVKAMGSVTFLNVN